MLDLSVVGRVVTEGTHHSGVICEFHYGAGGLEGDTVLGEEGEEGRTEYTPLWYTCVQDCG